MNPEGVSEFVNDIDGELMNFWAVLRNTPSRMLHYLWATPFSPDSFAAAKHSNLVSDDRVRRATGFFIRNRQSRQGLGKDFATPTSRTRRGMNENVSAWLSAIEGLPEAHARLKRVEIRNQDALRFIRELDSPNTLFYCDPPYVHDTRVTKSEYGPHEMTLEDHEALLHFLHRIEGKFLLSGYRCDLYDKFAAVANWRRVDWEVDCKSSSSSEKPKRTESIWANYEIQAN